MPSKNIDVTIKMSDVKVLIATEDNKVRECIVIPRINTNLEWGLRQTLIAIYGGENVASVSSTIGDIPSSIARYAFERVPTPKKPWIPNSELSRPEDGKRVLVKLSNHWICHATYYFSCERCIWKNDAGQELISVAYWKEIED